MIAMTTFGETAESVLPAAATAAPHEFSLVAGGPLFRLMCGLKLADSALGHIDRRILVALVIIWLPLLVLTVIEGHAWSGVNARSAGASAGRGSGDYSDGRGLARDLPGARRRLDAAAHQRDVIAQLI
jgi:hypothetical protein